MRPTSAEAKVLREASLIIWDEISMSLKLALGCVDCLLQQVMGNNQPFGGKVILLGGDCR